MAKGERGVLKYAVAEDSKDRLVLETKGSRLANLGCFSIIGGFFLLAFFLVREGLIFDVLFALGAAFGFGTALFAFFDKERWVFEESPKILKYTSKLRPWKNLTIKAGQVDEAEIEREVKEFTSSRHSHSGMTFYREKTYYRDVYTLYLILKNGRRVKVSRDGDSGYQRNLAIRLTGRTAKTIDMVKVKQKSKVKGTDKPSEEKEDEPEYKGETLSHWMELLNSQDPTKKVEAIMAVGMIGRQAREAESALIEALKDQDEDVRWLAAQHLGSIDPGEGAVQPLCDVLKNKQEGVRVRASAAYSLGRIRADIRAAVPALSEALDSEDALLRVNAAASLVKIEPSLNKESLKILLGGLKDSRKYVRNSSIRAIGQMGQDAREAVPELARALKDEDKWCRLAAAHALEMMGSDAKEAVPALYEALKDEDERLREAARSALDKIQKEEEK